MEKEYELGGHQKGWVRFDWDKDILSVQAYYEDTMVILKSGLKFVLKGRKYGV